MTFTIFDFAQIRLRFGIIEINFILRSPCANFDFVKLTLPSVVFNVNLTNLQFVTAHKSTFSHLCLAVFRSEPTNDRDHLEALLV